MDIEPVFPIIKEYLSENEKESYIKIGEEIIKNREVCVCTIAGGQGTRLKHNGPKGTFVLNFSTFSKSIFEINSEIFIRCFEKYGVWVKWYIMTSKDNDDETKSFFEENNYFDIPKNNITFFMQGEEKLVHEDGSDVFNKDGNVVYAANGNGGIFKALKDEKVLEDMDNNKISYMVACNVDNILNNPIDELTLGIMKSSEADLCIKSFVRTNANEKVGSIVIEDGKTTIVEYIDMPEELLEARDEYNNLQFSESFFGTSYLRLDLLKNVTNLKLPIHEAHKENAEYGKFIKKEMFIFDAFKLAKNAIVVRCSREEEFAPVKNFEGNDSPQTAIKLYENYFNTIS